MTRAGRGPAVVPLSVEEEGFLRAWSRAALTVPRAFDADLVIGQGMSLSEYTALIRRAWPTHLASVRRHMMDHLSELDLPVVTAALRRFASDTPYSDPQQEV